MTHRRHSMTLEEKIAEFIREKTDYYIMTDEAPIITKGILALIRAYYAGQKRELISRDLKTGQIERV
jgi:hypothetical protein